jgi:hypothetical protein
MARLGELLVSANLVPADKVEQAARAQVVWGARLGTNLIELGAISLDDLSRMLGQQHSVPAALERHFDKADPELQAQLPAEVAREFSVVPLVRLSPERIAVVALDPLRHDALSALAQAYGVDPKDGIVYSVAAEMRVLYHLERVYKIARSTRYLRSRNTSTHAFEVENVPIPIESDGDVAIPIIVDEAEHPTGRADVPEQLGSADDIAALIDLAIENAAVPTPIGNEPTGRDRRTYMRTLGDEPTAPVEVPNASALGRMAIKRVAVATVSAHAPTLAVPVTEAPAPPTGRPTTLTDAMRAIKRGPNRDRVADLVIETLESLVPTCEAALLLVVRGDVAIGWKHFARGRDSTPEVAVPLDQPGIVPAVIERQQLGRCAANDLGPIDRLLLREIGAPDDALTELAVAPVMIGTRVMCLVAAALPSGSDTSPIDAVAGAAGLAFARLIRDASR